VAFILACVLISQAKFCRDVYWRQIRYDNVGDLVVETAQAARDATKSNEKVLFFRREFLFSRPILQREEVTCCCTVGEPPLFDKIISDVRVAIGRRSHAWDNRLPAFFANKRGAGWVWHAALHCRADSEDRRAAGQLPDNFPQRTLPAHVS
jgi:hypothetical protein